MNTEEGNEQHVADLAADSGPLLGSRFNPFKRFRQLDTRNRKIGLAFFSSLGLKVITSLSAIITTPLLLNHLGTDRYGVLMTLVTFFSVSGYADFGIGNGLQNLVPKLQDNAVELQKVISSTFVFLIAMTALIILIGFVMSLIPSLGDYFLTSDSHPGEGSSSILAATLCFAAIIPMNLASKVQVGFQDSHINYIWLAIGAVLGLLGTVFGTWLNLGVAGMLYLIYGSLAFAYLCNYVHLFYVTRPEMRPRLRDFDFNRLIEIAKLGMSFFIINLSFAAYSAVDNLIVSAYLGFASVAVLNVGLRLVNLYATPALSLASAKLPAINDAMARGDKEWIIRNLKRTTWIILGAGLLAGLFFAVSTNPLIEIWIGDSISFSNAELLAFALYVIFTFVTALVSYVMMTDGLYKKLQVIYPIAVVISILVKVLCTNAYGLTGLLISTAASMTLLFFLPSYFSIKKHFA